MEVTKAGRGAFLDLSRCIDKVNNTKKGPHNVLSSLLTLLRWDKLQIVLEKLLELCNDVVYAREDNHDWILAHLRQNVQVKYDTLLSSVWKSNSYNCIDNLGQVNAITSTVLKGLKQLEGSLSHGKTVVNLVLERAKVDLFNQLWPDPRLCKSESKNFAHTLSELSLEDIPVAVDDGSKSFESVLFNLNIRGLAQLV